MEGRGKVWQREDGEASNGTACPADPAARMRAAETAFPNTSHASPRWLPTALTAAACSTLASQPSSAGTSRWAKPTKQQPGACRGRGQGRETEVRERAKWLTVRRACACMEKMAEQCRLHAHPVILAPCYAPYRSHTAPAPAPGRNAGRPTIQRGRWPGSAAPARGIGNSVHLALVAAQIRTLRRPAPCCALPNCCRCHSSHQAHRQVICYQAHAAAAAAVIAVVAAPGDGGC